MAYFVRAIWRAKPAPAGSKGNNRYEQPREEVKGMNIEVSANQKAAIERLIRIAQGDTRQSRRVANFLLAWWNAEECDGFDLTDLWNVDAAIAADMVTVFGLLAGLNSYPELLRSAKWPILYRSCRVQDHAEHIRRATAWRDQRVHFTRHDQRAARKASNLSSG
jgi:hypothetical protein